MATKAPSSSSWRTTTSRSTYSAAMAQRHSCWLLNLAIRPLSNSSSPPTTSISMDLTRTGTQHSRWLPNMVMKLLFVCFLIYPMSTPQSGVLQTDTPRCRRRRPMSIVVLFIFCKTSSRERRLLWLLINRPWETIAMKGNPIPILPKVISMLRTLFEMMLIKGSLLSEFVYLDLDWLGVHSLFFCRPQHYTQTVIEALYSLHTCTTTFPTKNSLVGLTSTLQPGSKVPPTTWFRTRIRAQTPTLSSESPVRRCSTRSWSQVPRQGSARNVRKASKDFHHVGQEARDGFGE
ncbi:hypothetical protein BKA70DRAFT_884524 [Coprinopsis sp. MPI-PUGE-AT-0042]|nr:hypothetical protein BKA70DRAFT_884524 [Coprinopsis sp. MPI-PUGE-AT-0042]